MSWAQVLVLWLCIFGCTAILSIDLRAIAKALQQIWERLGNREKR